MNTRQLVAALLLGGATSFGWATEPDSAVSTNPIARSSNAALLDFVQDAVARNPRVKAAQFAFDASQSLRAASARPLYNPELAFEFENAEVDTRTIGISQTLDWGGKRSARRQIGEAQEQRVSAEYRLTRQEVSIELLSALATYQTDLERRTLATERVRLMQQFLELTTKRFNTGDLSLVESNLAKLVYAEARMQRATTATDAVEAEQRLSVLSEFGASSTPPTLDTQLPELGDAGDLRRVLASLPTVETATHNVNAAKATALLRKRERRVDPTIGLTGGDEGGENLVGISISIPFPIRNTYSHEAQAANQQVLQEEQLLVDVRRRALARLNSALARFQIARDAWQEWRDVGQSSIQQQDQQLRELWRSGELSTTEFLVQTGQTIDSQESALDLRHSLWRAWFEWLGASGQIDRWLNLDSSTTLNSAQN